jgi:hypothetical protein
MTLHSKKRATYITKPKGVIPNLVQLEVAKERGFYGLANAMPQRHKYKQLIIKKLFCLWL